jgi:hypothetical protein
VRSLGNAAGRAADAGKLTFSLSKCGSENGLDEAQDLVASCGLDYVADIALEY